ncbi:peptidoglycan-binding protein [Aerosakkonemataceae cyanobacterium BLCC-F154]|uniref:Peptidoglycan-binding protein n=1 Tax=Floridaenema fluviatile BLCC-F154 TaxID=3153640 RepID=A0ABV4YAB3_9CYAN
MDLQDILNCLGYSLVADGIFGANTEAAVKKFQKDYGLMVDSIVGAKT